MSNRQKLQDAIDNATKLIYKDQSSFYELSDKVNDIIILAKTCGGNAFAYTSELTTLIESLNKSNLTTKSRFQSKKSKLKKILAAIYCSE